MVWPKKYIFFFVNFHLYSDVAAVKGIERSFLTFFFWFSFLVNTYRLSGQPTIRHWNVLLSIVNQFVWHLILQFFPPAANVVNIFPRPVAWIKNHIRKWHKKSEIFAKEKMQQNNLKKQMSKVLNFKWKIFNCDN